MIATPNREQKLKMVVDMTHPCDVVRVSEEDITQTLIGRMGTGGNNVPLVLLEINKDAERR